MRDYINSPRGREAVLTRGASVCFVACFVVWMSNFGTVTGTGTGPGGGWSGVA